MLTKPKHPVRLWVMSDLHIDANARYPFKMPDKRPDCDLVVIAGDICEGKVKAVEWVDAQDFRVPVVVICGNHEHYRHAIDKDWDKWAARGARSPVALLMNDDRMTFQVRDRNIDIFGGTLWTDYELYGSHTHPLAMNAASGGLNDHRLIRRAASCYGRFYPHHARELHFASRAKLNTFLSDGSGNTKVVVTHHAPSEKSIMEKYRVGRFSNLNPAYASNMDATVALADLWIHGHVHCQNNYYIGKCRVLSNPRGYVEYGEDAEFCPDYVVDV